MSNLSQNKSRQLREEAAELHGQISVLLPRLKNFKGLISNVLGKEKKSLIAEVELKKIRSLLECSRKCDLYE